MDPRFNRAHGAMAGLIFGRSLGVDTSSEEGATAASVCQAILELLTVDKSAEPPTLPSLFALIQRPYAILIGGVQVGISTPTKRRQAFADAVWNDHLLVEPTRQEFQASALVAAAITSAVLGVIRGATMFSPNNLATIERVSHPGVAPLSERLVERRVYVSEEASEPASTRRDTTDDATSN